MALGSTQPLTEMSTRSIAWGKGGRCERLTALPLSCGVVMKSGNLNFLEPSGPLHACNGTDLPMILFYVMLCYVMLYYIILYYIYFLLLLFVLFCMLCQLNLNYTGMLTTS